MGTDSDEALESIRRRPGMWVGDVHDGSALAHIVWEVFANALDEHLAGRCTRIEVEIAEDGSISVDDDGAGIRVDEVDGIPFAQRALTRFHDKPTMDGHAPHEHVALRGVGIFAVCAVSAWLTLDVHRDGRHFTQRFARGVATSPLCDVAATTRSGTRVAFLPDDAIFPSTWFDAGVIAHRLREMSYLLPRLTLQLRDRRTLLLHEPMGLVSFVASRARGAAAARPPFHLEASTEGILVEVAFTWGARWSTSIESFANVHRTTSGGTHVRGLLLGLVAAVTASVPGARSMAPRKVEAAISTGLIAVVCVRLDDPTYDQPTKSELVTPRVRKIVKEVVATELTRRIARDPALRAFLETLVSRT